MNAHETGRAGRSRARRAGLNRFYRHVGASTVVPGLGLLRTPLRRVGLVLVGSVLVVLLAVVVQVARSGLVGTALSLGLSQSRLLLVVVALVVGVLAWLGAILLTARVVAPGSVTDLDRSWMRVFTAACMVVVVVPSFLVGRVLLEQRSVVDVVFGNDTPSSSSAKPDSAKADPWSGIPRVNMLLLGSDAGTGREGIRTDSMIVASIDTRTGHTVLFGIPRNLEKVPFSPSNPLHALYPNGYDCGDQCLMNGVWTLATDHRDLFPGDGNPGLTATKDAIGQVLGLHIDDTTVIDLSGFEQLVNAMGGVDLNVRERVCVNCKSAPGGGIQWTTGREEYIEPGPQHLDGFHALWYARSRAQSDDFSRMRRQRCVVGAILDQANPVKLLANYGELAKALKENVSVSIAQDDLEAWAELVTRIQKGRIRSLPLTNKVISVGNPDYPKIHELVRAALDPTTPSATPTATTGTTATTTTATPTTGAPTGSATTTEAPDGLSDLAASC